MGTSTLHQYDPLGRARAGRPSSVSVDGQELLAELASEIAGGGDLEAVLRDLLVPVVEMTAAAGAAVRVLDPEGHEFHLVGAVGLPVDVADAERVVDRRCGACGAAVDRAESLWALDVSACSKRSGKLFFGGACNRMLVVPLRHRGEVLGVYNLFFAVEVDAPAAPVLALLRSMGDLLGLALSNARLEQSHLRAAVMSERQQMAAEVHDSVAQSITFVKMRLPLLEDALKAGDRGAALRYCAELRATATQAHAGLRSVLTQLRAPMDPLGFWHAIDESVRRFRATSACRLHYEKGSIRFSLSPQQESEVYHVVQEALNNVARHSHAAHAWLIVEQDGAGKVVLRVEDDGSGLANSPAGALAGGTHYGLDVMRERARRIGATLAIGPRQGGGTTVEVRFRPGEEPTSSNLREAL